MKTTTITTEEIKIINNQNESNLGFKNGMLGKFACKKQANIEKGKGKKKQIKKPKILIFSKQGLMDKKQRKNGVLKGKTKGKQEKKIELEEKKDFKDRPFGDTKKEKIL